MRPWELKTFVNFVVFIKNRNERKDPQTSAGDRFHPNIMEKDFMG